MKTVVCTLYEGSYHFGVGVLVNSLYHSGYAGEVVVGYRGALPPWAQVDSVGCMSAGDGRITLRFDLLETTAHFTNYKADYLLHLFEITDADVIFYLDPDIVVTEPWTYFEQWVEAGVAVCEDVNSPVPVGNPRRFGWRKTLESAGIKLAQRTAEYANGGFVGLRRCHIEFLHKWSDIQNIVNEELGGSDRVGIGGGVKLTSSQNGFAHCWSMTDQDALNAAIEACPQIPVSFAPRSMMGFGHGFTGLPHALGRRKPWVSNYISMSLTGRRAGVADEAYWANVSKPLRLYSLMWVRIVKLFININRFVSRFYAKK